MFTKLRQVRAALTKPADERSLSEKILIAGALSSIDYAASLVFRLGSTLIITRLLAPEIFGLFAVVMTVQYILFMITDFGARSLIIVSDNSQDPEFLRTCWSVQIVRGLFLWGLVALFALGLYGVQQTGIIPPETAFGASVLPAVLAVSGLPIAIKAFQTVNRYLYEKEMRFRRVTILNISLAAASPLLTIAIALVHPTIWALVIGSALANTLTVILGFRLFTGPRMGWCWKREHASELFRRGRWIMSNSALTAVTNQADQLVLGAFLPASLLGIYFLAKQIFSMVPGLIHKLHGAVGLQLFTDLVTRPDPAEIRNRYYRFRIPIDLVSCFLAGAAIMASPALIDLMYDPRYLPAGGILQILALGLPLAGLVMIHSAFAAQKRFRLIAGFGLIQAFSIWIGLLLALAVFESAQAAFLVAALYRIPEVVVVLVMARREGWISFWQEVRFLPVIGVGALVGWGASELYFALTAG